MGRRNRKRKSKADKSQNSKGDEPTSNTSSAGDATKSRATSSKLMKKNDAGARVTVASSGNESKTSKHGTKGVVDERIGAGSVNDEVPESLRQPYFNFGSSKFADIKCTDHFIDKTRFISVIMGDSSNVLITAPRAFGKSVNLDMLKRFFQITISEKGSKVEQVIPTTAENDPLFHDKNLWIYGCECKGQECTSDKPICERRKFFYKHRGKHPVIYVNFQVVGVDSYLGILFMFRETIATAFEEHKYLLKCQNLWNTETEKDKFDREEFNRYLHPQRIDDELLKSVDIKVAEAVLERKVVHSLCFLSRVLDAQFGCKECQSIECIHGKHKVYVLVDEYDAPINNALFVRDIDVNKVNKLVTAVFKNLSKDNKHVGHAFLTGISFMASVGLSGFRNIEKYSFLKGSEGNDDKYVDFFGLTPVEVKNLISKFVKEFWGGKELLNVATVEDYYNGYESIKEPRKKIYAIWSVLHALKEKRCVHSWEKSGIMEGSGNSIKIPIVRYALEKLSQNCVLDCYIPDEVHLADIANLRDLILEPETKNNKVLLEADIYLSFLFHQGYIAISDVVDAQNGKYKIKAANEVIRTELQKTMITYYGKNFDEVVKQAVVFFDSMEEHEITSKDIEQLCVSLGQIFSKLHEKFSKSNEDAYHCILFGILCKTHFKVCTELSGDTGRIDLVFHSDKFAVVIEVKYLESAEAALKQVKDNSYINIVNNKLKITPDKTVVMGLNVDDRNKVKIKCELNKKNKKPIKIL